MLVTALPIFTSNGLLIQVGGALVPLPSGINPAATNAGQSMTPSIRYSPFDPSVNVIFVLGLTTGLECALIQSITCWGGLPRYISVAILCFPFFGLMEFTIFTPSKPGSNIIGFKVFLYAVLFPFLSRKFSRKNINNYQQLSTVINRLSTIIDNYRQVINNLSITFLVLAAAVPSKCASSVPELSPYNPWKTVQDSR